MSRSLKENLGGILNPGALLSDISNHIIDHTLTADVRYACLYWVYHLEQSGRQIADGDSAHKFLSKHFLHWLEALSLIGRILEGTAILEQLETCLMVSEILLHLAILISKQTFSPILATSSPV